MIKIKTFFRKDPNDLGRVLNEVDPQNEWVFDYGVPTRKFDGTSCSIIDGQLYKRFELKNGRNLPEGAIPCQEPDTSTGKQPHWVICERDDPSNKWHFVGFDNLANKEDGTYELCGPKVQGNPENLSHHELILHGVEVLDLKDFTYVGIMNYLQDKDIEGIVFHHMIYNRMCKVRKSDFGMKR